MSLAVNLFKQTILEIWVLLIVKRL